MSGSVIDRIKGALFPGREKLIQPDRQGIQQIVEAARAGMNSQQPLDKRIPLIRQMVDFVKEHR
jgi:hypothetical protein